MPVMVLMARAPPNNLCVVAENFALATPELLWQVLTARRWELHYLLPLTRSGVS